MEKRQVMISALQHYSYCPRQCALIHLEQTFDENLYTLRGQRAHEKAHEAGKETRRKLKIERGLPLFCDKLGLSGVADVVEFELGEDREPVRIYPVEYKFGKRHKAEHDDIQLCAQALCLESMFNKEIPEGAIFHVSSKKRRVVSFNDSLRLLTIETVEAMRKLLQLVESEYSAGQITLPPPVADRRCQRCSLLHSCLPFAKQRLFPAPDSSQGEKQ